MKPYLALVFIFCILTRVCIAAPKVDLITATIDDKPMLGMPLSEVTTFLGQPTRSISSEAMTQLFYVDKAMIVSCSNEVGICYVQATLFDGTLELPTSPEKERFFVKSSPYLPFNDQTDIREVMEKINRLVEVLTFDKSTIIVWECVQGWAYISCYPDESHPYQITIRPDKPSFM